MDEITKLAFFDELVKIGFMQGEDAEALMKESGLLGSLVRRGASTAAKATKAPMSPQAMAAMKARWAAGAGRAGQATLRRAAPSAALRPMAASGNVGRTGFGLAA